MKTILLDIDGCILEHEGAGACNQWRTYETPVLLPDVRRRFDEWEKAGYTIVLLTSRKESCREALVKTLRRYDLFWDHLIMGLPHGERVLVNDSKRDNAPSARAFVIVRNSGLGDVDL